MSFKRIFIHVSKDRAASVFMLEEVDIGAFRMCSD